MNEHASRGVPAVYALRDLAQRTAEILQEIRDSGQVAFVTKHGRFLAAITPLADGEAEVAALAAAARRLDGIPGAREDAMRNLERARAGETIPLDDLGCSDEAEALLDEDGRRERLHAAMDELRAGTLQTVDAATARARIEARISLTRQQIGKIQDDAAAGALHVEGVAPAQLVFLAQMALEGDDDAWQAMETLYARGELSAQAAPPEQPPPARALTVLWRTIEYETPELRTIPCQSWRRRGRIRRRRLPSGARRRASRSTLTG